MSEVRVRFAPSPTGYLHIGGARTAIYNYFYARATGGKFILRVEDTDEARSKREYEDRLIDDLKWIGLTYDEGPDIGGDYGPYRQSERGDIYKRYADQLLKEGKVYHCFCSAEELEKKKRYAEENKLAPIYDGTCLKIDPAEAKRRVDSGESATLRFKAYEEDFTIEDNVRGKVTFPKGMVGDFVIMRSNGMPVFNFCCAIDDMLMKITDVVRGEDHLGNTLRQLMVYKAFSVAPPKFSHLSLLVGEDRQKLSKRHGSTAVSNYRDDLYLPEALANYLSLLGWSHPEEKDIFSFIELEGIFDLNRFSKSPAVFDFNKCNWVNGEYIKKYDLDILIKMFKKVVPSDHLFLSEGTEWQKEVVDLFREKVNKLQELLPLVDTLFDRAPVKNEKVVEVLGWETTSEIIQYFKDVVSKEIASGATKVSSEKFNSWMDYLKKERKIKGKNLFMGARVALTGADQGSDLKKVIPLTQLEVILERLSQEV